MSGGEERIAGVNGLRGSPGSPNGRAMATSLAFILNVVMDEREVMQELDRGGKWGRQFWLSTSSATAKQRQHRTESFAAVDGSVSDRRERFVQPAEVIASHLRKERRDPIERSNRITKVWFDGGVHVDRDRLLPRLNHVLRRHRPSNLHPIFLMLRARESLLAGRSCSERRNWAF